MLWAPYIICSIFIVSFWLCPLWLWTVGVPSKASVPCTIFENVSCTSVAPVTDVLSCRLQFTQFWFIGAAWVWFLVHEVKEEKLWSIKICPASFWGPVLWCEGYLSAQPMYIRSHLEWAQRITGLGYLPTFVPRAELLSAHITHREERSRYLWEILNPTSSYYWNVHWFSWVFVLIASTRTQETGNPDLCDFGKGAQNDYVMMWTVRSIVFSAFFPQRTVEVHRVWASSGPWKLHSAMPDCSLFPSVWVSLNVTYHLYIEYLMLLRHPPRVYMEF